MTTSLQTSIRDSAGDGDAWGRRRESLWSASRMSDSRLARGTLIDVDVCLKGTKLRLFTLLIVLCLTVTAGVPAQLWGQSGNGKAAAQGTPGGPPATTQFYPLSQLHRGLMGTAWTVFQGTTPEPMQVEILGVLRGARGPGQDMILARLMGAKPDFTGVVEGMSGSPVYIGDKLLGSLSYRIGQFSKEPIAGITPIQQMLSLRDLPTTGPAQPRPGTATPVEAALLLPPAGPPVSESGMNFQDMDTPLVMSGFLPGAIQLWQQRMAGTTLQSVAAGGMGSGASEADPVISASAEATLRPGSAVSAQLVRGDVEIAATCTVTYIDPKQLLACGHPVLQAGPVSLPMTTADVVTTLASPMNSFKIINTGQTVGAFTEDRESGIRGILGAQAHMIPMHIGISGPDGRRNVNVQVLDLPSLTSQAVLVVLYNSLLQSNESTAETSYHVTGAIHLANYPSAPLDLWVSSGGIMPAPMLAALQTGEEFAKLYSNDARRGAIKNIDLHVEVIPRRLQVQLVGARLVSNDLVHPGDTITIEVTLRPWQQSERNVRIPVKLPARLDSGNLRILVSDGATLDRTLRQPQLSGRPQGIEAVLDEARRAHPADQIYVSLLAPEAQATVDGQTLTSLPLSMANALEPMRSAHDLSLNGESAELAAVTPAGGVLSGYQVLNVHLVDGGGLH